MSLPVIDTHQHLWDLNRFRLPWHAGDEVASLRKTFWLPEYRAATEGLNIVKSVYMEVDVAVDQQTLEADTILELCANPANAMAGAVISGRPAAKEFAEYIRPYAKNRFLKGVRQVLHGPSTPQGYCLQPQFVDSVKLLGDLGLRYDLCMRPGELHDAVKLVDQCPQTRFVVDHCGNMSVTSTDENVRQLWQQGMRELAARPNTVCKISGIVVTASEQWTPDDLAPNMNFSMDTFGEDRVLFAGDWPVCTLRATFRQWLTALQTIVANRSEAFRRKLFHDNAVKFYDLA
jgi:L-fuconolactonase